VTVSSLQCEEIYSITAGGIIATEGIMGQTLDGPRFHTETVTIGACAIIVTTTLPGKEVILCMLVVVCSCSVYQNFDTTFILCLHEGEDMA